MDNEVEVIVKHDEIVELVEQYVMKQYGITLHDINFVMSVQVEGFMDWAEVKGVRNE
jgi:hypothetical protein